MFNSWLASIGTMTIDETVNRFNSLYELNKFSNENKQNYSCGFASEMDSHKLKFIVYTKCDSLRTVEELLKRLKECGYCITEQSPDNTSLYVYMKRKTVSED